MTTRFEPTLRVARMLVLQGERIVYDQAFHAGLNIIAGQNASGKTTIADLLCFGLGGDIKNWRTAALSCSHVWLEVALNGTAVTIKREIGREPRKPMSICWGSADEALGNTHRWETFPYAQSSSVSSFSNTLFAALGIPEVRGAMASRITMHQLLRLAYVDQMTPAGELFRHEDFDSDLMRDAVGALVCGVYDAAYYELEAELRLVASQLSAVIGQIRLVQEMLGDDGTPSSIEKQLKRAETERTKLYQEIQRQETTKWTLAKADSKRQKEVDELVKNLRLESVRYTDLTQAREQLLLEIADSDLFIRSLRNHLESLDEASVLREALGGTKFEICPACYSHVRPASGAECSLCKSPLSADDVGAYVIRLRSELQQQVAESTLLQRRRNEKLERIDAELVEAQAKIQGYRYRYGSLTLASPGPDAAAAEINRKIGYVDRQIEDLRRKFQLVGSLKQLQESAESLRTRTKELEQQKEVHESRRSERAFEAHSTIASITLRLLERDLDREKSFREAKNLRFDFGRNVVLLDGQSNFAASSMVYLKNSFHLAVLMASVKLGYFKYPRFLLLDNTEDKGMEPGRSHNFQQIVADWSQSVDVEHQVILTTSMVSPTLNVPRFVVGDYYTTENRTLTLDTTKVAASGRGQAS